MNGGKRIVAVHGGGVQPTDKISRENWLQALRTGIARDWPDSLAVFDGIDFVMPRYAEYFSDLHKPVDRQLDELDRRAALQALKSLGSTRAFRRAHYERLPGKSALAEFVADVAAPTLGALGLGRRVVEAAVPEFKVWWAEDSAVRDKVRLLVYTEIRRALAECESVAVVAHGFGSVVAYEALWQLGAEEPDRKLDLWVTCGAPLANNTVRGRLDGSEEGVGRRFPANLFRWHNLAAEDDYMCHDKTVADDFAALLRQRQISELVDHPIYNLAVRYGRSAPGHSAGYLVHPRMAELLADWLKR